MSAVNPPSTTSQDSHYVTPLLPLRGPRPELPKLELTAFQVRLLADWAMTAHEHELKSVSSDR